MYEQEIVNQLAEEIKSQLSSMVDENMDKIMGDLQHKFIDDAESDSDKASKFRVGYSTVISPCGDGLQVSSKVSWSVRKADESTPKTIGYTPEDI